MKRIVVYPAIFTHYASNNCYSVEFLDFSCQAFGKTIEEAFFNSQEAMEEYFSKTETFPEMTENISNIKLLPSQFISFVKGDMIEYYKKHNDKIVRKTLTIPGWLNELAIEKNINFSQVLKDALMEKLQIR